MKPESVIQWQYATNLTENEKRFNEVKELLITKMSIITKNALLTMTMMDECIEAYEMVKAIENGERGDFLYNKAKAAVEDAASLEEAGQIFYKAFAIALGKKC